MPPSFFFCLLSLCLVFSCRPEQPASYPLTPRIAVFTDPDYLPPPKISPQEKIKNEKSMIYVPGGYTQIGAADGMDFERPVFWVKVEPFFMDEHPVTVGEWRQFVQATGFVTQAERFGDGGFFDENKKEWTLKPSVNWQFALGKDQPQALDNHPVTQVSWYDAAAYARWMGKRLPHEFEWEHAARNAVNSRDRYPFGNDITTPDGRWLANIWNGVFPDFDHRLDSFHYTSPVGHFGKTPLGLTDMTGNVWQWCDNWRCDYAGLLMHTALCDTLEKVQRGGSFLCEPSWCHGYRVSGRAFTSPETSLMHVGFRCVRGK